MIYPAGCSQVSQVDFAADPTTAPPDHPAGLRGIAVCEYGGHAFGISIEENFPDVPISQIRDCVRVNVRP